MSRWTLILAMFARLHGATTFTKDVAPILYRNCVSCHHPGEAPLFSLVRYDEVKSHAAKIVAVTKARYMPPWLPEPGPLKFADERRLSASEIATLDRWVKEGALEGNTAELPPAPPLAAGWQFGQPDLILTAPQAYKLPTSGPDVYRNFIFPVPFEGTRYVRAVQIRPGNHGVVHHANLLIDRNRSLRWRTGNDGQPGFSGMDIEIPASISDPESHFLFWKHGSVVLPEPKGMAWTLEGGSDLILNVHVKPAGKPEQIQPSLGLYFTEDAPQFLPILVQLENDRALDIPPGARNFVVTDDFTLPTDADLLGVYPHAHYLGRDIQGTAILPDGAQLSLVHILRWDVNWQGVYRYAKPVALPKGTRIQMRWTYDNTTAKRVTNGDQATDEMAHLWLQLLPHGPGDQRIVIQEAVARKRLARDPDDFGARFNLGGILQAKQDPEDAIQQMKEAVRIRPRDEMALNALGALLQLRGQPTVAEAYYRRALDTRPAYVDAHYNLASLLLEQGKLDEAISHLREVNRIDPKDAKATAMLINSLAERGRTLADSGHLLEAVADLRDVAALEPSDSDAYANLGTALARQGDFPGAKIAFDRALKLNPGNTVARGNLERVQQHLK